MSIKTIAGFNQMMQTKSSKNWLDSVEMGSKVKLNNFDKTLNTSPAELQTRSFGDFLLDSIGKVNKSQIDANKAMEKLASGDSKNLHETMLAVEQADIAFRSMNQVRSKVIDAYREIMKMQM